MSFFSDLGDTLPSLEVECEGAGDEAGEEDGDVLLDLGLAWIVSINLQVSRVERTSPIPSSSLQYFQIYSKLKFLFGFSKPIKKNLNQDTKSFPRKISSKTRKSAKMEKSYLRNVTNMRSYPPLFNSLLVFTPPPFSPFNPNCRLSRRRGDSSLFLSLCRLLVWQSIASLEVFVVRHWGHLYWKQSICLFSTWLKKN